MSSRILHIEDFLDCFFIIQFTLNIVVRISLKIYCVLIIAIHQKAPDVIPIIRDIKFNHLVMAVSARLLYHKGYLFPV